MIDFFSKCASAEDDGASHKKPFKATRVASFSDKDGKKIVSILLEVASTAEERRHGMMGRDELLPICGMLFEGLSGGGYFWMKNCLIPLDVIFLDKDGTVTKTYSMPVDEEGNEHYEYDDSDVSAIEVNEGFCEKYGIAKGVEVSVSDIRKESANG